MEIDSTIILESHEQYDLLRLNRPSALNAFDEPMLHEWLETLRNIGDRTRPLVITGTGRAFCTGGDLKKYLNRLDDINGLRTYFNLLAEVFNEIVEYPAPTIVAVNGVTVAGGLELLCICDLAVAAESARIADGHVNYGLHPGAGASATLVSLVCDRRARWLLLTGEFIDADEAERIGLVNRVVKDEELMQATEQLVAMLVKHTSSSIYRLKELMRRDIRSVLAREKESLLELFQAPETRARLEHFANRSAAKTVDDKSSVMRPHTNCL